MDARPVRLLGPLIEEDDHNRFGSNGVGFVNIYRSGFVGSVFETRRAAEQAVVRAQQLACRIKITCKPAPATKDFTKDFA